MLLQPHKGSRRGGAAPADGAGVACELWARVAGGGRGWSRQVLPNIDPDWATTNLDPNGAEVWPRLDPNG